MWPINCETVTWFGNNWDGMLTFADHNLDFLSTMQPQRHVNICRLQFVYFVNNTTTAFLINFVTGRLRQRQNMYRDWEGNLTIVLFLCFIIFRFLIHYKTARLRHRQNTKFKIIDTEVQVFLFLSIMKMIDSDWDKIFIKILR